MGIDIVSHRDEILGALEAAKLRALERIGLFVEGEAKENITKNKSVQTGALRNSMTHIVVEDESAVYIGTDVEYGIYVELGTGKHAETGGRPDPWVYQDDNGNWHHTHGQRAKPYLKPAVNDSKKQITAIIKDELENA